MTIVHRAGNIHKNADGLSRWALPNTPDNPAYDPEDEINIPIMGIHTSDLDEEFYDLIRERYQLNKNSAIICTALKEALQENLLQLPPVDMQVNPILLPLLLPT
jgi:hypothetical protein